MAETNDLSKILARCNQVTNSPYIRREVPAELANLRSVLEASRTLAKHDVPALIAEIKRLRNQSKRLEAERDGYHAE